MVSHIYNNVLKICVDITSIVLLLMLKCLDTDLSRSIKMKIEISIERRIF